MAELDAFDVVWSACKSTHVIRQELGMPDEELLPFLKEKKDLLIFSNALGEVKPMVHG